MFKTWVIFFCFLGLHFAVRGQRTSISTIATDGWANNSVNTVIFRKNALISFKNTQYAAYYDTDQFVVLAKRNINSMDWDIVKTTYKGDASDAHRSISIAIDGGGYLHMAWGQHNNQLNYTKSIRPESLTLGAKESMVAQRENKVSYPEFYKMANGNLLFLYRDGGSGNGNLMINRYDQSTRAWTRMQSNLIDGEGQRNAYVQTAIDSHGTIHLSWVWRESPDVASNHDLCYAKSTDGGLTWENSNGVRYQLPITAANSEYVLKIPPNSELINQTSMYVDGNGQPFIASYWRDQGDAIPQYHIVYKMGEKWAVNKLSFRKTPFSLSGGGTKKIPIARPQVICWQQGNSIATALIFRDVERGNRVSIAINKDIRGRGWKIKDLTKSSVGEWEPNLDSELWIRQQRLDLFVQNVEQVDGEGKASRIPTSVQVLTWQK